MEKDNITKNQDKIMKKINKQVSLSSLGAGLIITSIITIFVALVEGAPFYRIVIYIAIGVGGIMIIRYANKIGIEILESIQDVFLIVRDYERIKKEKG